MHDLDKLQGENEELRKSIDRRFAAPESCKRPADGQLDRTSVADEGSGNTWAELFEYESAAHVSQA